MRRSENMEKILKKALDEALTERYSGELNSASEVNHAFSGDFERKMKALIRRTDKPLLYYSKYIAAAACAVVAIGCAVLLPALPSQWLGSRGARRGISREP